jgi:hypothetical protein
MLVSSLLVTTFEEQQQQSCNIIVALHIVSANSSPVFMWHGMHYRKGSFVACNFEAFHSCSY